MSTPPSDGAIPPSDGTVTPGPLPEECIAGTAVPCDCPGTADGYTYCIEHDVWGECECPPAPLTPDGGPDAGPVGDAGPGFDGGPSPDASAEPPDDCIPDIEWCDGRDNDCDGVVDNGHPCPDSTVRHTLPVGDAGVWLSTHTSRRDRCNLVHASRVWPTPTDPVNLGCASPTSVTFSSSPPRLHFKNGDGIVRFQREGDPILVDTPPCFRSVRPSFGFDGADVAHYQCRDGTIRRGAGERIPTHTTEIDIRAVFPSGRLLVQEWGGDLVLLDRDGGEISRNPIDFDDWVGSFASCCFAGGVTVAGESAFVPFLRSYRDGTRKEVVIVRVDADTGAWRVVRRAPVSRSFHDLRAMPLPDGSLVYSVVNAGQSYRLLVEVPANGPPRTLVEERADDEFSEDWWVLFPGPAVSGP